MSILFVWLLQTYVLHAEISRPLFYSQAANEEVVTFKHAILTEFESIEQVKKLTVHERQAFLTYQALPLVKFIFGPSTHRSIGGPQKDEFVTLDWENAYLEAGRVLLPLHYRGLWIVVKPVSAAREFTIPVPRNLKLLMSKKWLRCTDSDPEHQTEGFYWYFWDPSRSGCDHVEGIHYSEVKFQLGASTSHTVQTFPEYDRMLDYSSGVPRIQMTIAFGYVTDPANPKPDEDSEYGATQYREFLRLAKRALPGYRDEPIKLSEYPAATLRDRVIGHRLIAMKNGIEVQLSVVMSAGIDQIYIFAKSFAHDHDGFFAWMGHSRVGSGFDATQIQSIIQYDPNYYSVSERYQLVYWGGCNSYSYYTLPFFAMKSEASGGKDPGGTKNLDIVAHGLPSLFSLNSSNAGILLSAVLSQNTSYQSLINELELNGNESNIKLLALVLGDEDNR